MQRLRPHRYNFLLITLIFFNLQLQWEQREKQLLEENRHLKKNSSSSVVSPKELKNFQSRIESANETIAHLKASLSKSNVNQIDSFDYHKFRSSITFFKLNRPTYLMNFKKKNPIIF